TFLAPCFSMHCRSLSSTDFSSFLMFDLSKSKCTGVIMHFTLRATPVWQTPFTQAAFSGQSSSWAQVICFTAHLPFWQTLPSLQSPSAEQSSGPPQAPLARHLRPAPQSAAAVAAVHSAMHF